MSLAEFSNTQFGNLKAAGTNIDLLNNYFLATYRFDIDQKSYTHNGFVLFANNVENYNRMADFCWDSICLQSSQGIYFALANAKKSLTIERFIVGNTSTYSTIPKNMIFGLRTNDMINPNEKVFKNFDCSIFGSYFYQPIDKYFGRCQKDCDPGYYREIETQRCLKCNDNCLSCIGPSFCSTCTKKYVLIAGECLPCQNPCLNCDQTANRCLSCTNESMFNPLTFTCDKLCISKIGCAKCDNNGGKCLKCDEGYELSNNDCLPKVCGLKNCSLCTTGESQCKECKVGYSLISGMCVVCNVRCNACPEGYVLTSGICAVIASSVDRLVGYFLLVLLYILI